MADPGSCGCLTSHGRKLLMIAASQSPVAVVVQEIVQQSFGCASRSLCRRWLPTQRESLVQKRSNIAIWEIRSEQCTICAAPFSTRLASARAAVLHRIRLARFVGRDPSRSPTSRASRGRTRARRERVCTAARRANRAMGPDGGARPDRGRRHRWNLVRAVDARRRCCASPIGESRRASRSRIESHAGQSANRPA